MSAEFQTTDLALVQKKMRAFATLYDTTPVLWLRGYFEDKQCEMVHFRSNGQALAVGRKWILADVDGRLDYIKPTSEATFSIKRI